MPQHPIATLLVGAEGAAEIDGLPWVREATDEEREEFIERVLDSDGERYLNSTVDRTGRPYFLLTIQADAPTDIQVTAQRCVRCLRVTE